MNDKRRESNDLRSDGSIERLNAQSEELSTVLFQYDEVALQRWMERKCEEVGVNALLGAMLTDAAFDDGAVDHLEFATRYGLVEIEGDGFVDASGDASLCWEAGLELREPDEPVYGSLNFLIEGYDTEAVTDLSMEAVHDRLEEVGEEYGLVREDGHLMHFPGKEFMLVTSIMGKNGDDGGTIKSDETLFRIIEALKETDKAG
ncbi:FAD-dependent oxidoreductase [Natronorubrum sp. FCH18a]|uniref:FAD-dependent oxidoreductase n=1 Tax=Natronorubrum sp. FCH18a TaxID=3447018 RepID=UPI003F5144C8